MEAHELRVIATDLHATFFNLVVGLSITWKLIPKAKLTESL